MKSFFRKLRWLTQRSSKEAEFREELEFHLEEEASEREAAGLPKDEARKSAHRDLGNATQVKENTRAAWGWTFLEQLAQDFRYAMRTMRHNRAFTTLALLSLALGIGANTVIYSFMDSILLRALPIANPESLALMNWHSKRPTGSKKDHVMHSADGSTWRERGGMSSGIFPWGAFELLRKNDSIFSSLFAYYPSGKRTVTVKGQAQLLLGEFASGDYFRGLEVPPAAGRLIFPDDDRAGAPLVAVVNMGASERLFGSAANTVGQSILIDNLPFTVIGVTPPEFFGVDPGSNPDFYVPLHTNLVFDRSVAWAPTAKTYLDGNWYWVEMMGRLRPGVSLTQAQAVLAPQFHHWVATTASNGREMSSLPSLTVKEGAAGLGSLRRNYSKPLYVLWAMVGLILAIACANMANLSLSRATARQREMAVRLSIGAGRVRLIRQLLTESILLALTGGVLGVLLAFWGVRFLTLLLANGQENFTLGAQLNWHVLFATLALSVLCGVIFGLAPAIQSTRPDVTPALKGEQAAQPLRGLPFWRMSLSQTLVVAQMVFSLLMLLAAGLFVRTLSNLQSIPIGFNREHLLLFHLNARQAGHSDPEIRTFYAELRKRFAAIPGVHDATLSHEAILHVGRRMDLSVSGVPDRKTWVLNMGPRFFSTMQIPMLAGREIDDRDLPESPGVAVVNELFAKMHYGNENPLGRHVSFGSPGRDLEIVGVCANAHYGELKDDIQPVIYIPYNQGDNPRVQGMTYAVRTSGEPLAYVKSIREIVHQADSRIPVTDVITQADDINRSMNQENIFAKLCTGFAFLALIIAGVGLYGTMTYAVARRTREIGIRMALGAQRSTVLRMILRQVLVLAVVGLAIGLPAALASAQFVQSFLFGLKANDPTALVLAVMVLLCAVLAAGYVPAWKASRIDPITAIRHE